MLPADSPFAALPAPGPHPATTELRAYAAGTLNAAEQHRIEAHTLDCEQCADLVDGFLMTDAATTDKAVATLRTRLHARLGEVVPTPPASYWAWPRVAAAAALLGLVAGSLWTLEHRMAAPPATTVRHAAPPSALPLPTPAPPAEPEAAAIDALLAAQAATVTEKVDYAVASSARPTRRAGFHRSVPVAVRRPSKLSRRPAAPGQVAAANHAPAEALTARDTATERSKQPSQPTTLVASNGVPAAKPTPTDTAKVAVVGADFSGRGGNISTVVAPNKAVSANNASLVRVANTPMPAALAINPVPMGGGVALRGYLRRAAAEFEPETSPPPMVSSVRVRFVVEADGKLNNLRVVRGIRADYDSEALRIVCNGPAWQPGVAKGHRAPLPMEVTVPF